MVLMSGSKVEKGNNASGKELEKPVQPKLSYFQKVKVKKMIKRLSKMAEVMQKEKQISEKKRQMLRGNLERAIMKLTELFVIYLDDDEKEKLISINQLSSKDDAFLIDLLEDLLNEFQKMV